MEREEVIQRRLSNQRIDGLAGGTTTPEDAVAWMGAVQAQDYSGSLWAIALRCGKVTRKEVEMAIAAKTIVRTWPMRGTLHFLASPDIHWLLRLVAPRVPGVYAGTERSHGVTAEMISQSERLFSRSLEGGKRLSRIELYEVLEEGGIPTDNMRGYSLIKRAAATGLICLSSREGSRPTFALLDEWVTGRRDVSPDLAMAELVTRYFQSHGPATIRDFVWWSGLKVSDARKGIVDARPQLELETVEGKTCYFTIRKEKSAHESSSVHLLPAYDEYIVGYSDRSAILSDRQTQKMLTSGEIFFTHSNGVFLPTIVIGGLVAGTWQRVGDKRKAIIRLRPFRGLSSNETDAAIRAAEDYARFWGTEHLIEFRPHRA